MQKVKKEWWNNGKYFVAFTHGDKSTLVAKNIELQVAREAAAQTQTILKAKGKNGIITVFTLSTERGLPMQKCVDFLEV